MAHSEVTVAPCSSPRKLRVAPWGAIWTTLRTTSLYYILPHSGQENKCKLRHKDIGYLLLQQPYLFDAEIKNAWRCSSTPSYVHMGVIIKHTYLDLNTSVILCIVHSNVTFSVCGDLPLMSSELRSVAMFVPVKYKTHCGLPLWNTPTAACFQTPRPISSAYVIILACHETSAAERASLISS